MVTPLLPTAPEDRAEAFREAVAASPAVEFISSGKVRDLFALNKQLVRFPLPAHFELPDDTILILATDRISAFDYILPTQIPDKGEVLTRLSLWWFKQLADIVPNHVITDDVAEYPDELREHADLLRGRSLLCKRLNMLPAECVARAYLSGSAYADYRRTGAICGVSLPAGLVEGSKLPEPIFTPATKAERGRHDENITFEQLKSLVGGHEAEILRDLTLAVLRRANDVAGPKGMIVADTKLEFGYDIDGRLTLADEVLTPDSSRFWPLDGWAPGGAQPSFDKQFVRDWLEQSGWDKNSEPPPLPAEVVLRTREKYVEAYERLTGEEFVSQLA